MRDEQLQDLLRTAAARLERTVVVPGELAERVLTLDKKRRRNARRLAVAAPLAVVGIALASWGIGVFDKTDQMSELAVRSDRTDAPPSALEVDLGRLATEADHHYQIAMRLMALRKRDRAVELARSENANQEPDGDNREKIEVVAYSMIIRADGLRQAMRPNEEVLAIYRHVVHLFPNTHSAELARQRLTELGVLKGDI